MNKKKTLISALALTLLTGAGATYAYQGDPNIQGPNYSPERHEAMTEAFQNKDYETWKNLMEGKGRVKDIITEENFDKFVEMHNLRLAGDIDGSNAIREELGLNKKKGKGAGQGIGGGRLKNKEKRGNNLSGNFLDNNGDGACDHLDKIQDEE